MTTGTQQATRRPFVNSTDRLVAALVRMQQDRPLVAPITNRLLVLLGIHVQRGVRVGADLLLPHATAGLVIHQSTRIGDRVTIFHNVTIGRGDAHNPAVEPPPGVVLEDDVVVCAGAVVLTSGPEPTIVGRGTVVGANAVLACSTGPGEVWAGIPARRVR